MQSLSTEQFTMLCKSLLKGGCRFWWIEDAFSKKTLVINRKTDDFGRFDSLPCRLAGGRDDEIRQCSPLYFSGAFQHRMNMGWQAGFKSGGL